MAEEPTGRDFEPTGVVRSLGGLGKAEAVEEAVQPVDELVLASASSWSAWAPARTWPTCQPGPR
jgi:hypothetical protein